MYHDPVERTAAWVHEARRETNIVELKISCNTGAAREFLDMMLLQIKAGLAIPYKDMIRDFRL